MSFADEPGKVASRPGAAIIAASTAPKPNLSAHPSSTAHPSSSARPKPSVTRSAPVTTAPVTISSPVQPISQPPASPVASQPATSSEAEYARAVFDAVNQARAHLHLPALAWSNRLALSANRHNAAMAATNTLAHQVGGEDSLGARESRVGVRWHFAAENIGWTTARTLAGALGIEASMLGETAPNDAHRRNILSKDARALGIDVLIDVNRGRLWLTEDFADVP